MASAPLRTVSDADVSGKRVLLRVDLNVPMQAGVVTDASRIDRVLPTIQLLAKRGARIVVLSHYGRPKGRPDLGLSLRPVARALDARLEGLRVQFVEDTVGKAAQIAVNELKAGEVLMLENLRFHAGEEANDPAFIEVLGRLGDIYVNDAFSVSHRAHASTDGLARALPSFAGLLMAAEIEALSSVLDTPERPVAAVVGGAKVSSKIDLLENLCRKFDLVIIGGGMANTFLHARGVDVGRSLSEKDLAPTASRILDAAQVTGCEILLPSDAIVAKELKPGAQTQVVSIEAVPGDAMILDIGPATLRSLTDRLSSVKTLLWNGPLGAFEIEPFGEGTFALARKAAALTKAGSLLSVAGGGDTVAALNAAGVAEDFTYVSTAGGAFLEWLEGKELPGVAALKRSQTAARRP